MIINGRKSLVVQDFIRILIGIIELFRAIANNSLVNKHETLKAVWH